MIDGGRLPLQLFPLLSSTCLQVPDLLLERGHGAGIQGIGGAELLHPAGQHGHPLRQAGRLRLLLLLGRGRAVRQQLSPKRRRGGLHSHPTLKTQTISKCIIKIPWSSSRQWSAPSLYQQPHPHHEPRTILSPLSFAHSLLPSPSSCHRLSPTWVPRSPRCLG